MSNGIQQALIDTLEDKFPDISIYEEELTDELQEPAFHVKFLQSEQNRELGNRFSRRYYFDIQFFDPANHSPEETADLLYDVMELLFIEGMPLRGTGMRHEILESVLHFYLDYGYMVRRQVETPPLMQNMEQEEHVLYE